MQVRCTWRARTNMTAITELLAQFVGKSDDYDVWERQAKFLKTTYHLNDDIAKVMIGMRLKRQGIGMAV